MSCPPRPHKVLHSEVYTKYVEAYKNDARYMTPWEKTLDARPDPRADARRKLPTHWIGYKDVAKPDEAIAALWKLRDFMMKDVLTIRGQEY